MAKAMTDAKAAQEDFKRTARKAAANPWVERLTRFGYVVRGVIYIIPGILALQLAMGQGGQAVNQTGAIEVLGAGPFGKLLLALVALGLIGYSLWGFIRAIFDPFHDGDDAEGIAARLGYVVSAIGYAVLLVATVQYIQGAAVSGNNPQDWTAQLLSKPFGRVIVGIFGLGWMFGGGLRQTYQGYKADFKRNLQSSKMTSEQKRLAVLAGRVGMIARGVAFFFIGLFLVQAAVFVNPGRAKGLDGVLLDLAQRPYGQLLLALVALGLIAFGLYSILSGMWIRIRIPVRARR
jgi:hypothetical protein